MNNDVIIIGAGPAGLTAGYLLSKHGCSVCILEADPTYVGGIARTVNYKGFCFDIGGHRFFSKSKEIDDFWTEMLPHDMLERPRSSRIFYNKRFFTYPLKLTEVLYKLGPIQSLLCCLSYLKARIFPIKKPRSFADWVSNHFGQRLFRIFFKTYTEKVWGMPCENISADWAAQRIKGLSFFTAVLNALVPKRAKSNNGDVIKTLIGTFRYPRKGPGMLWQACADKINSQGGNVMLGARVTHCHLDDLGTWHITYQTSQQVTNTLTCKQLISSAPLRELAMDYLGQQSSTLLKSSANQLKYRDFLIVSLILKDKASLTDNWIYIHDPSVDVARIQNFKSWSQAMVPDPNLCCYGLEYFCFEQDGLWDLSDADLILKAKRELVTIGLAHPDDILDGTVIRQVKAYPVYDADYKKHVSIIKTELERHFPTLHVVGRNGMHKYNNQDHAMMTAMLTVKNIMAGKKQYDVWNVNEDAEYHESGNVASQSMEFGTRKTPSPITES